MDNGTVCLLLMLIPLAALAEDKKPVELNVESQAMAPKAIGSLYTRQPDGNFYPLTNGLGQSVYMVAPTPVLSSVPGYAASVPDYSVGWSTPGPNMLEVLKMQTAAINELNATVQSMDARIKTLEKGAKP